MSGIRRASDLGTQGVKTILDGSVQTADLANGAVTQSKLNSALSGVTVTTSALRSTAVPTPFEGQVVYETDTDNILVWDSSSWVGLKSSTLTAGSSNVLGTTYSQVAISAASQVGAGITLQPSGSGAIPWSIISVGPSASQGAGSLLIYRNNSDGSSASLKLDSSGRMTLPYQPAFSAYMAGNYGGSNAYTIPLDATLFNRGGHYSTSTYRFTAPVAGAYHFSVNLNVYQIDSGNYFMAALFKNGVATHYGSRVSSSSTTGDQNETVSATMTLAVNDYVTAVCQTNDSSYTFSGGSVWNSFTGFLIG